MHRLLIYIYLIHFSTLLFAEGNDSIKTHEHHSIVIYTGYSRHIIRDGAISPFIYRGATAPLELKYKYSGEKLQQRAFVYFDQLKLNSSIPDYSNNGLNHYVQNLNINIGYSFQRKLTEVTRINTVFFIGAEISSLINYREHYFVSSTSRAMFDQFNSIALSTLIEKRFKNKQQILSINISIPFVSYALLRGTYNAYVGEKIDQLDLSENVFKQLAKNGDFITFNNLFDIKTEISFVRYISKHLGFELNYCFHYYKFTQYDNLLYSKSLQNQLLIGLVVKF